MFSIEPFSHCAYLTSWEETVLTNFFNTTFSFRRDSDISVPYGRILVHENSSSLSPGTLQKEFLQTPTYAELRKTLVKKDDKLLWIASHCWTDSKREDYVKDLNRFINVSVIGACTNTLKKEKASNENISDYYFYLAFENSRCKDYITEKFFRGMQLFLGVPAMLILLPLIHTLMSETFHLLRNLLNIFSILLITQMSI